MQGQLYTGQSFGVPRMPLSQFKSLSGPKVYVRDFPAGLPILFGAITLAG